MPEILVALFIHAFVPLAGAAAYCGLTLRMRREAVERPPNAEWFGLFFTYGGWLLVILTLTMWRISGAAILGLAYLVLVAPIVMGAIALRLENSWGISAYHHSARIASIAYFPLLAILLATCWFLLCHQANR